MIISDLQINHEQTSFIISNNNGDNKQTLFLNYEPEYEKYISSNYDGALIMALPIAMKRREDIIVKGKVSYKLYQNIKNHIMKILSITLDDCGIVNIHVDEFSYGEDYNNIGVGCGLSWGIDSLCCLEDHYFNIDDGPDKLTHVTNFHSGGSNSEKIYDKRLDNAYNYSENTSLKMLKVNTNFMSFNNFGHSKIHSIRNLCIPLFFQKLFRKYYYSSAYSYIDCKIKRNAPYMAYCDPIFIPLLSTENIDIISHGCQYSRPEKTYKVAQNPLNIKYLDVCVDSHYVESDNKFLNCSKCWKCMRTLVTLDYYDKLDNFSDVFELEKYKKQKNHYLKHLNKSDPLQREIIELYSKTKLKKNEWYAFKNHWNIINDKLISNHSTLLKKEEVKGYKLPIDKKMKIGIGYKVLFIKDASTEHYLVQTIESNN
jgi:hypothetical protein